MTDCTSCRHFLQHAWSRDYDHVHNVEHIDVFGRCDRSGGPQNPRRTSSVGVQHLPVSRLVSDGMTCDSHEPWNEAA